MGAAGSTAEVSEVWPPDWEDIPAEARQIARSAIISLSALPTEEFLEIAYTEHAIPKEDWRFEEYHAAASAALREDIKLNKIIYRLVPKKCTESEFWRLYFSEVNAEDNCCSLCDFSSGLALPLLALRLPASLSSTLLAKALLLSPSTLPTLPLTTQARCAHRDCLRTPLLLALLQVLFVLDCVKKHGQYPPPPPPPPASTLGGGDAKPGKARATLSQEPSSWSDTCSLM